MPMMPSPDQWGGPSRLSAWESLMWRAEADPRTRSTGVLLEILADAPDWERFRQAHEKTVRRIPRLRERIVEPALPLTDAAWSFDEGFNLDLHVHRAQLRAPGGETELFELIESTFNRPLDRARPPWEATLVTGLEGGRAAYLFKFHHSLSDGLGLVQLLTMAHSTTSRPSPVSHTEPLATRPVHGSMDLLRTRATEALRDAPRTAIGAARGGFGLLSETARRPVGTALRGIRYAASARRALSPPPVPRSPLLNNSGVGNRLLRMDFPLDGLRAAGKAAECSVNDAFVAAMLGSVRRFHERHGVQIDEIPIGIPVSLRRDNDPIGGNRFAGAQFVAPVGEADPARRMRLIHDFVTNIRSEPALGIAGELSPILAKLPTIMITELAAGLTTASDLQVSNIRGISHASYLAGSEVLGMYPLGPRPGVAIMAAMITYNGGCCLGLNVNPHVFPDLELLRECLTDGFEEVIALGRPVPPATRQPTARAPRTRIAPGGKRTARAGKRAASGDTGTTRTRKAAGNDTAEG